MRRLEVRQHGLSVGLFLLALLAAAAYSCDPTREMTPKPSDKTGMFADPRQLPLEILPGALAWCKITSTEAVPDRRMANAPIGVVTYEPEGTYVVGAAAELAGFSQCFARDLRAVRVAPSPNSIVGTIATITRTIAGAGVSTEVITVGETDYFLVPEGLLEHTANALRHAGHPLRVLDHN